MNANQQMMLWPEMRRDERFSVGDMAKEWTEVEVRTTASVSGAPVLEDMEKWIWAVYLREGMPRRAVRRRSSAAGSRPQLPLAF